MTDRISQPLPTGSSAEPVSSIETSGGPLGVPIPDTIYEPFQADPTLLETLRELPTLPELPRIELANPQRDDYMYVLTNLVAADLPNTGSEIRHRDRHLWLNGLASIARDVIAHVDQAYPREG